MLTDSIRVSRVISDIPEPEDIFSASASLLFPDDTAIAHGDPGSTIVYTSSVYGPIPLYLAFDPEGEEERRLFAHYLWNAGVWLAEAISGSQSKDLGLEEGERRKWCVEGHRVLEMGAGTGLAGIVSALAGAEEVTLTDYPTPSLLSNISHNIKHIFRTSPSQPSTSNTPDPTFPKTNDENEQDNGLPSLETCKTTPTVAGHAWGDLTTPFAATHAHHYTRVLAADCLWMPWQHENLARSMLHFLALEPSAPSHPSLSSTAETVSGVDAATAAHPRVWVIAGFHTGRDNVASFFDVADTVGLEIEERWEVDVEGRRREWLRDRAGQVGEDVTGRKRWLVVAVLRRRGDV